MNKTEKVLLGLVIIETGALAYFCYEWFSSQMKVKKYMKANPTSETVPVSELPKGWVTTK